MVELGVADEFEGLVAVGQLGVDAGEVDCIADKDVIGELSAGDAELRPESEESDLTEGNRP